MSVKTGSLKGRCEEWTELIGSRLISIDSVVRGGVDDYGDEDARNLISYLLVRNFLTSD